jgi:hypothetical protein
MAGSKMIIFGGWDGEKALSDLHVLDTGTAPPTRPLAPHLLERPSPQN